MSTVRKSLKELSISKERLGQLNSIRDKDIDYSDIPKLDEDFWKKAELVMPSGKKQLTVRLDADVLAWLKSQGKGYHSRINAILRSYYVAHREESR
ncbi:MAG TPA: 3-oxoacyl-ACP synthase [Verrucomicrobia bacterium]|jgi:uncharacterized protein (DUF4415 family)|nr:3-oxoacyl-ACP synthase [Candidatus Manganitrophaceae bacterium]HIL71106.1 3-oxoacyl-ACP synthase [Verrucomicrobiota bacterium]